MSALWNYMSKQHGLNLLESEIDDILTLARQEIELPTDEEIDEEFYVDKEYAIKNIMEFQDSVDMLNLRRGAKWAIANVRNPYPKSIRFLRDDEEFFTK
jgi:hypothetical protein